uniref:Prenylcysteine oxidase 1 like n=1 Tax=Accipiter nisus TaxID=211598 RepID=A0A8B9M186_9AVES
MLDFVKILGLKHRREVAGKSAIFSGEHFVLEETDWYLLNLFRLWWHYGISFLRLQMWVEEVMEKFMRIYKYQAHGYAFSSLEEMLRSLGGDAFVNMTQRSVAESLLEVGVTQRFVDDVIAAVLRSSYGQSVLVPAFAGAMSLAGAQGSTWAVEGGNKLVCSGLLKLTKANVIPARVTGVSLHSSEGRPLYQVHYEGGEGHGSAFYDMVVVTTPLHPSRSNFTFENFEPPIADFPGAFQPSVTSVVHGYLNSSYFGFPDPKLFPFASILTTDTPDLFFNAMDNICPVNISAAFRRKQPQEAAVWRVLSQQPLDKQQLKTLFRSYYSVQQRGVGGQLHGDDSSGGQKRGPAGLQPLASGPGQNRPEGLDAQGEDRAVTPRGGGGLEASVCSSLGSIYCLEDTRGSGARGEGTGCVPHDLNVCCLRE